MAHLVPWWSERSYYLIKADLKQHTPTVTWGVLFLKDLAIDCVYLTNGATSKTELCDGQVNKALVIRL
jgi:hypothetical protein